MTPYDTDVYIVAATRTPIGAFGGVLSGIPAPTLGAVVIKALLLQAKLPPKATINEGVWGCVLSAGLGQAPARQAMLEAGLPPSVGATTVNKVCGSGMKAIMMGADSIALGNAHLVVAGGFESMSNVPYYMPHVRQAGFKMGHKTLVDGMIHDGLWDPYQEQHMGQLAEQCASQYHFTREAQDAYAAESVRRAMHAVTTDGFKAEITPVPLPSKANTPVQYCTTDEQPTKAKPDKLPLLKPAFVSNGGTITAGNASSLNDGAAGVLLASGWAVSTYGLTPIAKLTHWTTHSQEPQWFTTAPIGAIQALLKQAQLNASAINWYEVNEAFAVVAMAAIKHLDLDPSTVNPKGGAVALGHPIGATGARVLVTMLHGLKALGQQRGLATLCIGGGEATGVLVEVLG
jgi:acetyl-CoA C-acetyltransferase